MSDKFEKLIREIAKEEVKEETPAIVEQVVKDSLAALFSPTESEPFLTAGQLAAIINKGESTIYRDAQDGKIPCFKFGDTVRFLLSEVKETCRRRPLNAVQDDESAAA